MQIYLPFFILHKNAVENTFRNIVDVKGKLSIVWCNHISMQCAASIIAQCFLCYMLYVTDWPTMFSVVNQYLQKEADNPCVLSPGSREQRTAISGVRFYH